MTCEKCGKNAATTHITRIVNGLRAEQHLCASCAQKQGVSTLDLTGMWNALFAEPSDRALADATHCPTCGASLSEIAHLGRACCPDCYVTFYDRLLPAIRRIHGNAGHAGKTPAPVDLTKRAEKQLEQLRDRLDEKLAEQAYEECAALRDRIQTLEKQLGSRPAVLTDGTEKED